MNGTQQMVSKSDILSQVNTGANWGINEDSGDMWILDEGKTTNVPRQSIQKMTDANPTQAEEESATLSQDIAPKMDIGKVLELSGAHNWGTNSDGDVYIADASGNKFLSHELLDSVNKYNEVITEQLGEGTANLFGSVTSDKLDPYKLSPSVIDRWSSVLQTMRDKGIISSDYEAQGEEVTVEEGDAQHNMAGVNAIVEKGVDLLKTGQHTLDNVTSSAMAQLIDMKGFKDSGNNVIEYSTIHLMKKLESAHNAIGNESVLKVLEAIGGIEQKSVEGIAKQIAVTNDSMFVPLSEEQRIQISADANSLRNQKALLEVRKAAVEEMIRKKKLTPTSTMKYDELNRHKITLKAMIANRDATGRHIENNSAQLSIQQRTLTRGIKISEATQASAIRGSITGIGIKLSEFAKNPKETLKDFGFVDDDFFEIETASDDELRSMLATQAINDWYVGAIKEKGAPKYIYADTRKKLLNGLRNGEQLPQELEQNIGLFIARRRKAESESGGLDEAIDTMFSAEQVKGVGEKIATVSSPQLRGDLNKKFQEKRTELKLETERVQRVAKLQDDAAAMTSTINSAAPYILHSEVPLGTGKLGAGETEIKASMLDNEYAWDSEWELVQTKFGEDPRTLAKMKVDYDEAHIKWINSRMQSLIGSGIITEEIPEMARAIADLETEGVAGEAKNEFISALGKAIYQTDMLEYLLSNEGALAEIYERVVLGGLEPEEILEDKEGDIPAQLKKQ